MHLMHQWMTSNKTFLSLSMTHLRHLLLFRAFVWLAPLLFNAYFPAVLIACQCDERPPFLVLLVNARQLNYQCTHSLIKTVVKHPSDYSKNSDVGHAWIYLEGTINGQRVFLEGGHSGETGECELKYFDGLMELYDRGDSNPIRYLSGTLHDGFFQEGCGGHTPTFAAKLDITQEQFENILLFIDQYPFSEYALIGNQCSTFVAQIAAIAGIHLNCAVTLPIEQDIKICGETICLWNNPAYSQLTIGSPDILEKNLKCAVKNGFAQDAREWYRKTHPRFFSERWRNFCTTLQRFPERLCRYLSL